MQVRVRFDQTGRVLGTFELHPSVMQGRHVRFDMRVLENVVRLTAEEMAGDTVTPGLSVDFYDYAVSEWVNGAGRTEQCFLVDSVLPVASFPLFTWNPAVVALRAEICRRYLTGIWSSGDDRLHRIPDLWDVIYQNDGWKRDVERILGGQMNSQVPDPRDYEFQIRDPDFQVPRVPAYQRRRDVHPPLIDPSTMRNQPGYSVIQTLAENLNQLNLATRAAMTAVQVADAVWDRTVVSPGEAVVQGIDLATAEARILAAAIEAGNHGLDVRLVGGDAIDASALARHVVPDVKKEKLAPRVRRRCLDLG